LSLSAAGHAAPDPPPPDPVAAATAVVDEIQATGTVVRNRLRDARARRDVVKVLCLDDKLNRIDLTARSARELRDALLAAAAQHDDAAVAQERARLDVRREIGRRIAAETQQCAGDPEGKAVDVGGEVHATSPSLPTPDDYPPPPDVFATALPPLPVSPFK
jgi:hypothetical protein